MGATYATSSDLSLLVGRVICLYFLWVNTATLSMDRAMAWVESLGPIYIFVDVEGYIISSAVVYSAAA